MNDEDKSLKVERGIRNDRMLATFERRSRREVVRY